MTPEGRFKAKVINDLKQIPQLWYFVKEAHSLRGIPDIIGCYCHVFFAWELKASAGECRRKTGRIVLQRYLLSKIREAGGIGEFVCPENYDEKLMELRNLYLRDF